MAFTGEILLMIADGINSTKILMAMVMMLMTKICIHGKPTGAVVK
jgi:hypothetical protein